VRPPDADPQPLVPIVRSLLKCDLDSPEFADAAQCAGPLEIEFALEILAHMIDVAVTERAEVHRRMAELRAEHPGIEAHYLG
jgi:hypothetical protein